MPGGGLQIKKENGAVVQAPENLPYCRQTPEGGRDYRLPSKNRKNSLTGATLPQRSWILRKVLRGPWKLYQVVGRGLPLYEASP